MNVSLYNQQIFCYWTFNTLTWVMLVLMVLFILTNEFWMFDLGCSRYTRLILYLTLLLINCKKFLRRNKLIFMWVVFFFLEKWLQAIILKVFLGVVFFIYVYEWSLQWSRLSLYISHWWCGALLICRNGARDHRRSRSWF